MMAKEDLEELGRATALSAGIRSSFEGEIRPSEDTYWLTSDEDIKELLGKDRNQLLHLHPLEVLKPLFSRLNSTSNIPLDKANLFMAEVEEIMLELQCAEPEDNPQALSQNALLESLSMFAKFRIMDALLGYRGKLVTEHRRTVRMEGLQQQRKKLFGLF